MTQRGAWGAQLVKCPTLTQVMISQLVGSSPASGSVLTARSPEPASDSVSPCLSAPLPLVLCLSLSKLNIKKINKKMKKIQFFRGLDSSIESFFHFNSKTFF